MTTAVIARLRTHGHLVAEVRKALPALLDCAEALEAVTTKLAGCYIEASSVESDPALAKARAALAKLSESKP